MLVECSLDWVELAIKGKAFDGQYVRPAGLNCEHEACLHWLTVDNDCAGAAHAMLAADVGARESEVLTDEIDQKLARLDAPLVRLAVHPQADGHALDLTHCPLAT